MTRKVKNSREEHARVGHVRAARYWIVWAVLIALTITTYAVSRVHLGHPWHLVAALAIACAKSALVVLFFMHLWDHGGANRLVFGTSVFFVVLLIGLVVLDNATRFTLTNPGRGATLRSEPPGPDILSPQGPPEPGPGSVGPEGGVPGGPPQSEMSP
jgi:cytochrome c oxidase subunit 4